ncbi:MAG: HEAT repeat domain-containing protein [Verrucomicrobiae bacterium]
MKLNLASVNLFVALAIGVLGVADQSAALPTGPVSDSAKTDFLVVSTNTEPATNVVSPEVLAHKKNIRDTTARLTSLSMNDDQASLDAILVELKNPDKEIRTAALSATVQFNDRSAIPALQKIADETEDPDEKVEILKAIDYMKQPSFTEYLAHKREMAAPTNAPAILSAATNSAPAVHP